MVDPSPWSFPQLGYFLRKHPHKDLMKRALCFYLGPAPNHSHDTARVLVAGTNRIGSTRDVAWSAHPVFHDPSTRREDKEKGDSRVSVDREIGSITADPVAEDESDTELSSDDSDCEDSGPMSDRNRSVGLSVRLDPDLSVTPHSHGPPGALAPSVTNPTSAIGHDARS